MERRINHKVGVKILSDMQMRNVLPTYQNLFQKINVCRKVACGELRAEKKRHYQYNFMYDNVFSILGQRGTGKTSVVFTLKEKIKEKYAKYADVVLPLIIPEVIPENCTVLGWILAIIREEIESLENRIAELEKKSRGNYNEDDCRYHIWKKEEASLLILFDELSQLFYAGQYNPANESSYYRAIDNSVKQAEDYYKFAQKIAELWDAWVRRLQYFQELKYGKKAAADLCPMIYFIFDDVDLAPQKIEELLGVIIKYLSHPNVIVITTAHEELVLEVIENRLDQNIGRLPKEWRRYLTNTRGNREILINIAREEEERKQGSDLVSQTARMYLGKVLPTSTRYYLQLFNTAKQKELFCLDNDKNLGEGVKKQIQILINCVGDSRIKNFMCPDKEIVSFYLQFIGNTSRQISNVYIALQELVENLKNIIIESRKGKHTREKLLMQVYQNCRYFLYVAINANHSLSDKIELSDKFVDEVFLPEYNQWKMYIDYSFLNEFLKQKYQKASKQEQLRIGLQLYALLVFEESIMLILEKGVSGGITGRVKVHAVSYLTEYIRDVAFKKRYMFRDDLPSDAFFDHYTNLLNHLEIIVADEMSDMKFNMAYFYDFREDCQSCRMKDLKKMHRDNRRWFKELAGMLSTVYGNVYLITKTDIEDCMVYSSRTYLMRYQRRIDTQIKNNIRRCFYYVKMQEEWNKMRAQLLKIEFAEYGQSGTFFEFVTKVHTAVLEREGRHVGLRQILDITWIYMGNHAREGANLADNFSFFPKDMYEEIRRMWRAIITDSEETRNMILKYIEKISKASVGQYAVLRDPENTISILQACEEQGVGKTVQLREMQKRIMNSEKEENVTLLERSAYDDLINLLTDISREISDRALGDDYWDDTTNLRIDVEELFGDIDIIIEITERPEQDMRDAVELGIWVMFLLLLQEIYIFQIADDRYESWNSSSSRELEKVSQHKGTKETYYYQIFRFMVNIISGNTAKYQKEMQELEFEEMKTDVMASFTREREKYVDFLMERDEDE